MGMMGHEVWREGEMVEIEGVGEAVTGGIAARAVEPEAGEGGHSRDTACLNCRAPLHGDFCHACGQKAHVHRTIDAWWHDFLHSVLHLDGKFWRTMPMLAWRPGDLTRRYIEGERARFISPLALFLFSVFLMFAAFSIIGGSADPAGVRAGVEGELRTVESSISALEKERAEAAEAGRPTEDPDRRLTAAREEAEMLRTVQKRGFVRGTAIQVSDDMPGWMQTAARKAGENPALLLYKLQANGYKFSWALIPISVPFLWLLFLHRKRYRTHGAYDHLVFVTYSISFISLLLIAMLTLSAIGISAAPLFIASMLIPPIHIYRQLKGAYSLSRWSALWRTAVLLMFAFISLNIFFLLLLAVGVLG
jgi:hypothetical protein